jgi:hypothetical protein
MKLSIKQWTFTLVIDLFAERRPPRAAPAAPAARPTVLDVLQARARELTHHLSSDNAFLIN